MSEQVIEYEKKLLANTIAAKNGSLTEAAKELGISFRSIRYRVYKYGLREGTMQKKTAQPSVYFIQCATEPRLIKIGHSGSVNKRLSELSYMSPVPLAILGVVPGGLAREKELHRKFRRFLHHGEWFSPAPELLAWVSENAAQAQPPEQPFVGAGI
ncbi:MAG TPA: helix-turn-helix domain-containing protein [Planctomycetota bacterium]|nr:helix-turn-helix domain-containing protein [Planctomycetota bacterium]